MSEHAVSGVHSLSPVILRVVRPSSARGMHVHSLGGRQLARGGTVSCVVPTTRQGGFIYVAGHGHRDRSDGASRHFHHTDGASRHFHHTDGGSRHQRTAMYGLLSNSESSQDPLSKKNPYLDNQPAYLPLSSTQPPSQHQGGMGNGVFIMLLINFALHAVAYFWNPSWIHSLALSHLHPQPWQFITAAFVHANWEHLFGNAFSLLVFGRMVEEEEGAFGLWVTYLVCGLSGNLASYFSSIGTATVSLGASSAVFGLFIVGVLTKLRPSVKRLLEAAILGSYVVKQVLQEVQMVAAGQTLTPGHHMMSIGHVAHLGGAVAGVCLVILLSRLPEV